MLPWICTHGHNLSTAQFPSFLSSAVYQGWTHKWKHRVNTGELQTMHVCERQGGGYNYPPSSSTQLPSRPVLNSLYNCHHSGWSPGCFLFWMQQTAVLPQQKIFEHLSRLPLCHTKTRYYFFANQKRPWLEGADILQKCSEKKFWRSSTPKQSTATKWLPLGISENLQGCSPAAQKF